MADPDVMTDLHALASPPLEEFSIVLFAVKIGAGSIGEVGLRRAMHPLTHRRKGAQPLTFANEYDVQDLLHALLRPWVADVPPPTPDEMPPTRYDPGQDMDTKARHSTMALMSKSSRDLLLKTMIAAQ